MDIAKDYKPDTFEDAGKEIAELAFTGKGYFLSDGYKWRALGEQKGGDQRGHLRIRGHPFAQKVRGANVLTQKAWGTEVALRIWGR